MNADITPHLFVARVPGLALLLRQANLLSQQRYEQHRRGIFRKIRYLNAARPFPLPAEGFDFVYCAHMLEHLELADAAFCMRQVHRVLRKGGIFRIAVPDLDELIRRYDSSNPDEFLSEFFEADQKLNKNRHHWHYNEISLRRQLESAGFTSARRRRFREGECVDLSVVENRPDSLFMEARR
ncbi:MAG: methyltransferase domain-containing protein [Acidobacteria bacterium]|nr:methyltransferase domain-containing protein [Acidobacteriota bacterium]